MRLAEIKAKYPEYEINKTNSSYGNYSVRLSPSIIEFFFRLSDVLKFIQCHKADIASGNMFKAVQPCN